MNNVSINRKPIFDEVRRLLGRGLTQADVRRVDAAIDSALNSAVATAAQTATRLGALSAMFESGGRGPGAVSSGQNDPGGVSYGIYQLASKAGTVGVFLKSEGAPWIAEFGKASSGSAAFSKIWRAIAEREPDRFADAQHAFIERTHYRPAVQAVLESTGLDLDSRHPAVRDATWSVSVQHGGAARILGPAVAQADENAMRTAADYDRVLLHAIYAHRTAYVLRVAERSGADARRTLESITRSRYPAELDAALAMLDQEVSLG